MVVYVGTSANRLEIFVVGTFEFFLFHRRNRNCNKIMVWRNEELVRAWHPRFLAAATRRSCGKSKTIVGWDADRRTLVS